MEQAIAEQIITDLEAGLEAIKMLDTSLATAS